MQLFYAVVHQEADSAFGVSFPDIPGCFSAADDERDVMRLAQEALSLYVADLSELPTARSIHELRKDPEVQADLHAGAFVIAVPLIAMDHKARYNLMLDTSLVAGVDQIAGTTGISRSEFVSQTIERRLQSEMGTVVKRRLNARLGSEGTGKSAATSAAKVLKHSTASKAAKTAAASVLTQSKSKETTSAKAASAAAKVMKDPKASKDAKAAAASALTQKVKKK